jgi:hypothetical protein
MLMSRLVCLLWVGLGWVFLTNASTRAQSPVETIKNFGAIQKIDLNRLLDGDILVARGSLMDFPNGISGQTCFAVPAPAGETAKRIQNWDSSPHSDMKVYAFHSVHSPCELADFQSLDFKSNQRPVRWLLDKTLAIAPAKSELNLSRDEAKALSSCAPKGSEPQTVSGCWANLLFQRATAFQQRGWTGLLPYEAGRESVSPADQLRAMLHEQPEVIHEFAPLLKKIGLLGNETAPSSLTPFYYWTLFDADHHGTLNLGAVYLLAVEDRFLLADISYYVSGSFYTSITLRELWPIQVGQKSGTLVWRGDYFAAPTLAFTKGTERIAYGALMLQDIKRETRHFQDDLKSSH